MRSSFLLSFFVYLHQNLIFEFPSRCMSQNRPEMAKRHKKHRHRHSKKTRCELPDDSRANQVVVTFNDLSEDVVQAVVGYFEPHARIVFTRTNRMFNRVSKYWWIYQSRIDKSLVKRMHDSSPWFYQKMIFLCPNLEEFNSQLLHGKCLRQKYDFYSFGENLAKKCPKIKKFIVYDNEEYNILTGYLSVLKRDNKIEHLDLSVYYNGFIIPSEESEKNVLRMARSIQENLHSLETLTA